MRDYENYRRTDARVFWFILVSGIAVGLGMLVTMP